MIIPWSQFSVSNFISLNVGKSQFILQSLAVPLRINLSTFEGFERSVCLGIPVK